MANPSESGRPTYELAVLVVRRLLTEPGVWSARTLAGELGEYERRVQRVVAALPAAGWQVERDEGQRLTVTDPTAKAGGFSGDDMHNLAIPHP